MPANPSYARNNARFEDNVYSPNWTRATDPIQVPDDAAYGRVFEVTNSQYQEYKANPRLPWNFWTDLVNEIYLRLERTERRCWLGIPFANETMARRFVHAVRQAILYRHKNASIEISIRYHNSVAVVFIRRGSEWSR